MRCFTCCLSNDLDLSLLQNSMANEYTCLNLKRVLSLNVQNTDKYLFCFYYGSLVFWGFNEIEEKQILEKVSVTSPEGTQIISEDLFSYQYGDTLRLVNDDISLIDKKHYTKLAVSYALSQSVKLSTFEAKSEQMIEISKDFPEQLATEGRIKLSRRELPILIGKLLKTRHSINLHLELLDTPIFFWDNPQFEKYYLTIKEELEIERRLLILNQRLSVIQDLLEMLDSDRKHKDAHRLEWAIVLLIVAEVLILLATEVFEII
ncbi:MAG: RMD1 family protein [Gammaproteobacteria bacterium]